MLRTLNDRALSEMVSTALILILVIALAVIVVLVAFGYAHIAPKSAYLSARGSSVNLSTGTGTYANTIALFHFQGDQVNLNQSRSGSGIAPVGFNLALPSGDMEHVQVSPLIAKNTWSSGDTVTLYEDAAGYWVTDSITSRIAASGTYGNLVALPGGNYTVNIVDLQDGVLVDQVPVLINGTAGVQYSPGLLATYYSDQHWGTPAAKDIAYAIHYADTASGRSSDITNWPVGLIGTADHFSVNYEGYIRIDTEADYTYTLGSDDGSTMDIDGTSNFINNGGDHAYTEKSATVHLKPGYHAVAVHMYENAGAAVVYLYYQTPAMSSRQLETRLYHIPSTAPFAAFTAVPRAGPVPLAIRFTDASMDATSWAWNFGDTSSISHLKSPSHIYTADGTYSVTLTASNSFGSSSITKTSYITTGTFSPGLLATYYNGMTWTNPATTRIDSTIDFTDQGSSWPNLPDGRQDNFSVMWDGYILVPSDADYTFSLASDDGSYLYLDETQLIDNGGDHSTTTVTQIANMTAGYHHLAVKMYENGGTAVARLTTSPGVTYWHIPSTPPVASFIASPRAGTPPFTVQFTDTSSDATGWSWDFGDGSAHGTGATPSHLYSTPGTYAVTLTASNKYGSSTASYPGYITAGTFSPGFNATYYYGMDWTNVASRRIDSAISFTDQGSSWPNLPDGRQDTFSVMWDGYLLVPSAADYTFSLTSDDGSYLYLDETQLINNGGDHSATTVTQTSHLIAGYHHVVVKMYENGGVAVARLTTSPAASFSHMP